MIVREFLSREKLGMLLYFALALAMMLGGIAIILSGYSTAGLVAMGAPGRWPRRFLHIESAQ